ncbi:DNA ligase 1-like [Poecilia latipinna]|uniref:DNA ligase 1-like n=1 Tax=Poecilia latipinna TaxID=48699 RepID=UPI00072EC194|nr:PREDICTED: DNA ligase 1-like [Poecilia latipinna]
MESNQRTIEEVASDNIVEREVQPPKPPKRKKKMSFAVWWALHAAEELKMSAENMEQQDSSSVIENKSSTKALEKVNQKGDGQSPESESNENNQEPLKTCSEEHVPIDQEVSAGNIEKQNDSLVSAEDSIAGVQETVNIVEKEQPSKSEEQPPKRKRNKKKMIPFHIWLEKHAPTDVKTSAEHTEKEDDSLVPEQESISILEEKPEQEESSKTSTENVIHQDTSLPEEGDQEDSFTTEICKDKLVSFTSEPVTEKKSVTEQQKKVDQKGEKQSKRIKKTPLLWKSFPETDACIDLTFFCENSDINGILSENQSHQAGLLSSEKKTLWKVLPKSEPCIDVSFFAQNIETHTVISATEPVTENKSVTETHKKMDQKGEKQPKTKRNKKTPLLWRSFPQSDACIDLTFFTKNSDIDDGPLPEKENYQEAFSSSGKKPLWKIFPKSEPCIDISFFAENIETKNVSMPAEGHDDIASLKKKNYSENTVISTTQLITTEESILKQKETLDQKGEKHPSLGKPMDNIQTGNLTEVPVDKTEEKIQGEGLTEIQNLPHSPENTSQAKRADEDDEEEEVS